MLNTFDWYPIYILWPFWFTGSVLKDIWWPIIIYHPNKKTNAAPIQIAVIAIEQAILSLKQAMEQINYILTHA